MNSTLQLPVRPARGSRPPVTPAPPAAAWCYAPARVRALFDAMAATYGLAPWLSGGLLGRWRRQLARGLRHPTAGPAYVVDLMAGGADLWPALCQRFGAGLRVTAVDFSGPMLARAAYHAAGPALALHQTDALATRLPAAQATAVTCAFGLKTLAPAAYPALMAEAARLLRPGGQVALVELCLPAQGWRRSLLLKYLDVLVPVLRWLYPAAATHAALARYAQLGPDVHQLRQALCQAGFGRVRQQRLWPGCAVLLTADKQDQNE